MKEVKVIKRYQNRKLYDTHESSYVTLDEIAKMIKNGTQVFRNPKNPTYFPQKNIQAANLTMFQQVLLRYFMSVSAIPQCE